MDQLFKVLWSNPEITNKTYADLKDFVEFEEYETDSIQMDLGPEGEGNISNDAFGQETVTTMKNFIEENKRK